MFPIAFVLLSTYNYLHQHWVEGSMYLSVALGFLIMGLMKSGHVSKENKVWNVVSWVLIVMGVVLFLVVLRMDAYGL